MRIENIRQVKAQLNRIVAQLSDQGSVVITKNGRPCAVLMPVTEDTDLEIVALSQSKRFWALYDRSMQAQLYDAAYRAPMRPVADITTTTRVRRRRLLSG